MLTLMLAVIDALSSKSKKRKVFNPDDFDDDNSKKKTVAKFAVGEYVWCSELIENEDET